MWDLNITNAKLERFYFLIVSHEGEMRQHEGLFHPFTQIREFQQIYISMN